MIRMMMILLRSTNNYNHNSRLLALFLSGLRLVNIRRTEAGGGGCPGGCKQDIKSSLPPPLHSSFQGRLVNYSSAWEHRQLLNRATSRSLSPRQMFRAVATAGQAPPSLPVAASARAAARYGLPMESLGNHWEKTTIMYKALEFFA